MTDTDQISLNLKTACPEHWPNALRDSRIRGVLDQFVLSWSISWSISACIGSVVHLPVAAIDISRKGKWNKRLISYKNRRDVLPV